MLSRLQAVSRYLIQARSDAKALEDFGGLGGVVFPRMLQIIDPTIVDAVQTLVYGRLRVKAALLHG